jgi:hypothetical protein
LSTTPTETREVGLEESALHQWRFWRFRSIGFDEAVATLLADADVDWHDAERLVRVRGCPADIAAKILL